MQTIYVYLLHTAQVEGKEAAVGALLPEERLVKANRYAFEKDRRLSLAAGYLVRRYVGDYTVDEHGKPKSERVWFNLSHSGDLAALAVSNRGEVGIDVESISADRDQESLAAYCLSEGEYNAYRDGQAFLALFTAKESLAKAEGTGLVHDVKSIPALPVDGRVEYRGKPYYRHLLQMEGYHGSVSAEGEDYVLSVQEVALDL